MGTPSHAVGPVLPDLFREPVTAAERAESRARLGVTDPDAKLVVVVAGSWGVGDVADTARAIRDSGVGIPVVLCGNNEQLRIELDRDDIGIALGWTKDIRAVLAASDALVHNAGGLSCLEGFAVGVPVIGHACLPGHGHRNAEAMRDAGVAAMAPSTEDLIRELRRLAGTTEGAAMAARARALFLTDPTDELLALACDPVAAAVPAQRPAVTWAKRVAAVSVAVPLTMGGLSFGVAEATVHGVGFAEGHNAVYVAADRRPRPDAGSCRRVRHAGRGRDRRCRCGPQLAHRHGHAVTRRSADVTVVGSDDGVHSRNPRRQRADINAAAGAVAATGEAHAKVVCLRNPSVWSRSSWVGTTTFRLPDRTRSWWAAHRSPTSSSATRSSSTNAAGPRRRFLWTSRRA